MSRLDLTTSLDGRECTAAELEAGEVFWCDLSEADQRALLKDDGLLLDWELIDGWSDAHAAGAA